jgi:hypothetical protein
MEQTLLRTSNIINYVGGLQHYYGKPAVILAIETLNDGKSYHLKVKKWEGKFEEIYAYQNEIDFVAVDLKHLNLLGFTKDPKINIFMLDRVTIIRPIFHKLKEDGSLFLDDKGFVIVERNLPIPFTEDQMIESTESVVFLHLLQNYYSDKLNKPINPELFL